MLDTKARTVLEGGKEVIEFEVGKDIVGLERVLVNVETGIYRVVVTGGGGIVKLQARQSEAN